MGKFRMTEIMMWTDMTRIRMRQWHEIHDYNSWWRMTVETVTSTSAVREWQSCVSLCQMKDKRIDCRKIAMLMCIFGMTLNFHLAKLKTKSSLTNGSLRQELNEMSDYWQMTWIPLFTYEMNWTHDMKCKMWKYETNITLYMMQAMLTGRRE